MLVIAVFYSSLDLVRRVVQFKQIVELCHLRLRRYALTSERVPGRTIPVRSAGISAGQGSLRVVALSLR